MQSNREEEFDFGDPIGCAVVASDDASRPDIEEYLASCGAAWSWISIRPGRLVASAAVVDENTARGLVAALRAANYSAVLGPADEAHNVGWSNRNKPTKITDEVSVCFPWAFCDAEVTIEIDPGSGFGAGDHPSTHLLLEALAHRLVGGEEVLDVGCGSGVLTVAAACLGAFNAVGIDINRDGLVSAGLNAAMNGVSDRTSFLFVPLREVPGNFDVVLANIHDYTLRSMANELTDKLKRNGWLGLSGISSAQVSRVEACFPRVKFERPINRDEWVGLVGKVVG
ncbi:MAG: 50S ribosomal protein L11 methyltransferase [Acidimicrobiales bacterium]|jgi:ribosomal protein L11 methyltransferase|nr:50S ribosomal protein L11 methyltransferase [Acidimicrobiales bacterium]